MTGIQKLLENLILVKTLFFIVAGFGLASHLGVLADIPTIGIGKNVS